MPDADGQVETNYARFYKPRDYVLDNPITHFSFNGLEHLPIVRKVNITWELFGFCLTSRLGTALSLPLLPWKIHNITT